MKTCIKFALLIATAVSLPSMAEAQGRGGQRTKMSIPITNPLAAQYWPDLVARAPSVQLAYPPTVNLIEGLDRFDRRITAAQFESGLTCGAQSCSTRIYIDGALWTETQLCAEWSLVNLAADGTFIESCGTRIDIPTKLPD